MLIRGPSWRGVQLAIAASALAAGVLAGCDSRTLSWSYLPEVPALVQPGRRVALVGEYADYRGPSRLAADLTNSLAGDMMTRGYRVTVLSGGPVVGSVIVVPAPPPQPAPAPGQPPPPPPASMPPAGPTPQPYLQPAPPSDAGARYAAARDAHAAVLIELHVSIAEEVNVTEYGGPRGRRWRQVTVTPIVPQASLRISRPQDRTMVATVAVQYDQPTDDPAKVAADLCMGLDFIRQGAPPQRVVLKGSEGDVTVKVIRPPPGAPAEP